MLAPNISKLLPSTVTAQYLDSSFDSLEVENTLCSHHFNHSVLAMFPDTLHIPSTLKNILSEDSNYYKLKNVALHHFMEKTFIEAFVKRGKVTALSLDTCLDIDNCICLTPSGFLILSVQKDVLFSLGIEQSKPAVKVHRLENSDRRYLITIDLKEESFVPFKKSYERVMTQLKQYKTVFDFIIAWQPNESKVCPSSIASYFHRIVKCHVEEYSPSLKEHREYDVKIPTYSNSAQEIFEWLGLFSLGYIERVQDSTSEFLSSYTGPAEVQPVGQIAIFQWSGLLLASKVVDFFDALKDYVKNRPDIPWVCLHVQGFEDSPVSWHLQPHNYIFSGENNFSAIVHPSGTIKSCKMYTTFIK